MRSAFRQALAASTVGLALAIYPLAALSAAPLDGKVFVVDSGPKGKPADEKDDVLTFRDGRFHSSSCDKYGFGTGAYDATTHGAAVVFTTETTSEKDGRLAWTGRIEGGAIEGTVVHYRKPWLLNPSPEPRELWFKGRIKE
ncbi:MAG: hypothetical protein ACREVS_08580 [Burkholderiales bacterium]